jgi:hypothetical protein
VNGSDYPLCKICRRWADEITNNDPVQQRKIGLFSEKNSHAQAHNELLRMVKILHGNWASLPAWLGMEE